MEINGFIVNYNEKSDKKKNANEMKRKYAGLVIELAADTDFDAVESFGLKLIRHPKNEKTYISVAVVSKSDIDPGCMNNEYGGTFHVAKATNGVIYIKSAVLESIF